MPILYSFRRCPYAMRARLALCMAGVPYEHREILLRDKPSAMLEISAKGTVPVLQLDNGKVLAESIDIMHWALEQKNHAFKNINEEDHALIIENDTIFKQALDRYKYANRYEDACTVKDDAYNEAMVILSKLDERLKSSPYLSGELSFVDIALMPFIRQFSKVDETQWAENNNLLNLKLWLNILMQSSEFKRIMNNYNVWCDGAEPVIVEN
ncbi:MAG: glutathione S-transferase [bacterium]|jgi:glutathione S-transferase